MENLLASGYCGSGLWCASNIGEATSVIAASALGSRIDFKLQTDFLDLPEDSFDVAILSHSSWYFRNPEQLLAYFKKMRRMAKRICIAEWGINFTRMAQRPHFAATALLALYSEFIDNEGNVQHVFDSLQLQEMLDAAGWTVRHTAVIDAGYLQDGAWEVDYGRRFPVSRHGFSHWQRASMGRLKLEDSKAWTVL